MICHIFEAESSFPFSKTFVTRRYNSLKKKYFKDISPKINVDIEFSDLDSETVSCIKTFSNEVESYMNGGVAKCLLLLNKNVDFNRDELDEVLLHELIHLWQLSTSPETYEYKNVHGESFVHKAEEISRFVGFPIRSSLRPSEVVSAKEVAKIVNPLKKDARLVLAYSYDGKLRFVTFIPYCCFNKLISYMKENYPLFLLKNAILSNYERRVLLRLIPLCFGNRDIEVYENYLDIESLLEENRLDISKLDCRVLGQEMLDTLEDLEKEDL